MTRTSWDTTIKHLARENLLCQILNKDQLAMIPRSNISRWKKEPKEKYQFSELNKVIQQELDLIKKINQSSKIKSILKSYFQLSNTLFEIIGNVKNIKSKISTQKVLIVNAIEKVSSFVPINSAIKIFNISRTTFEKYKSLVIHKCNPSYFNWCTKRFSKQLLSKEVLTIKSYLSHKQYKHWSKSSIYLKAIRDSKLFCSLSTFYKYARLLGYHNNLSKNKSSFYSPVVTTKPNELWCADVTIFKTTNGTKFHIHFLMDHYSKMILDYQIGTRSSPIIIKKLIKNSLHKYKPDKLCLLTDAGSENVNQTVSDFIKHASIPIKHLIAQKDVVFSNSMVEALNKVIKHQFLYPQKIDSSKTLHRVLNSVVIEYNTLRPQLSLKGNTPIESYNGKISDFSQYSNLFSNQLAIRIKENKKIACGKCK